MPTTNPVPSQDPSDLLFNAGKLDEVVSGSNATYIDRLGISRRTMAGIDAAADLVLGGLGYAPPVAYASGIALTLTTQTVEYSGEVYAPKVANLPFTTSGTFETAKFRLIQGVASADLASGGGAAMVGYTPAGTGAVATTVEKKLREKSSINDFGTGAADGTVDTSAIAQAVATLCDSEKKRYLYIPNWGGSFKWVSPVAFTNPGVRIFGDQSATYNRGVGKDGWLLGQSGLTRFFDLGASRTTGNPADQWQVEGIGLKQEVGVTARTIDGISFTSRTNGPDRGANIRDVSFIGLKDAITVENPDISTVIANLNIEGSVFTACKSAVNAKGRVLGFRFVNNQCEQNFGPSGVIRGGLDGPVTITDNMLEGQPNAICIESPAASPRALIERNYLEANSGDYAIKFAPTSVATAVLELGENYVSPGSYTDYLDFVGGRLIETSTNTNQKPTITNATIGSKLNGLYVHKATAGATAKGVCLAETRHLGKMPSGVVNKILSGTVAATTPFGNVTNAHSFVATNGATQGAITGSPYTSDDVVVCVTLFKATAASTVTIGYYDQASVNIYPGAGIQTAFSSGAGDADLNSGYWHLAFTAFKPTGSGTGVRFRFGSGLSGDLTVAGWGYYVIPAASIYTRNGQPRADCEIWAPIPVTELRGSTTYDPPSLVDGSGATATLTVTGAALGDYVEAVSFSNDIQGITVTGWVSSANTVSIRFQNETGGTVDLASGTLRAIVKKS